VVALAGGDVARDLVVRLSIFLARAEVAELAGPHGLRLAWLALLHGASPFIFGALIAGSAAVLLQTGFLIHGGALMPDANRINPRAGLRRMLGPDHLVEAGKSVAKIAVMGFATWQVLRGDLPALALAPRWDLPTLLRHIMQPVLHVLLAVLVMQAALAALDMFWVHQRHATRLRMSRHELRDEQKETEGDPRIKARIRQIRMQRARRRMMAAVPKATVVVTNPTHYAVALAYDRHKSAAPRVVAKGIDSLAARIREVAEASRVPLVANPPLAQALYRVALDREIPAEHYQAVAEIIAYVWRLGRRIGMAA